MQYTKNGITNNNKGWIKICLGYMYESPTCTLGKLQEKVKFNGSAHRENRKAARQHCILHWM